MFWDDYSGSLSPLIQERGLQVLSGINDQYTMVLIKSFDRRGRALAASQQICAYFAAAKGINGAHKYVGCVGGSG
jgi:hypothetical protein